MNNKILSVDSLSVGLSTDFFCFSNHTLFNDNIFLAEFANDNLLSRGLGTTLFFAYMWEGFFMTDMQKERITFLRGSGESYAKIAAALYISENTVKSFCRRNNIGGGLPATNTTENLNQTYCKQCGNIVAQTPKRKTKIFCSLPCRMAWWKAHPENVNQKAVYSFSCPHCNKEFSAYGNKGRKFCSHAGYIASRFGNDTIKAGAGIE
jgi:endogenous inhibitor of DNA gyrase (YacG/DUF329 family)